MRCIATSLALVIVGVAGTAIAAPTIDGKITAGDNYGSPLWLNTVPTGFGDNVAGSGSGATGLGAPNAVNTGVEIRVPIAAIGYSGSGPIKICAFIADGGNGSVSNQWLGGLPLNTGNQGSPASIDLTTFAGIQHVEITPTVLASAPVIDGVRDAVYGGIIASPSPRLQTNYTGYGKSNHNQVVRGGPGTQNGSELDNIYVGINGGNLYIHFGGNLEANGNRLNVFIDSDNNAATGQNQVLGGSLRAAAPDPLAGAFPLNNCGAGGGGPGLKFDAGFGADYFISVNGSDIDPDPVLENNTIFTDAGDLPTAGGGAFFFVGTTAYGVAGGGAPVGGDPGAPDIRVSINNSNVDGVAGDLVGSSTVAPNVDFAYGSELNGLYGKVEDGRLYLLVTGNLERNYNCLILFFDVGPGGQNRLRGDSRNVVTSAGTVRWRGNVDIDFNNLNQMGANQAGIVEDTNAPGTLIMTNGLKFDSDFAADYVLRVANGDNNNDRVARNFANAAFLRTGGRSEDFNNNSLDFGAFDGGIKASFNPIVFGGPRIDDFSTPNSQTNYAPRLLSAEPQPVADPASFSGLLRVSINNSNVGGVTATTADPVAVAAVTTGVEYSLDLNELGWDGTSPIKVAGFITSGNWQFMSNQVLGDAAGTANLGTSRNVDFSTIAGNQYVIVPVGGPAGCNRADITDIGDSGAGPDGQLTVDDLIAFVNTFGDAIGCPGTAPCNRADITDIGDTGAGPDGELTVDDIIAFVNAFGDGCPE